MADNECPKPPKCEEGAAEWMTTYGDMVTLLLCFFVLLMNPEAVDGARLELIMYSFNGLGPLKGGNTLDVGELAELGHSVMAMPSKSSGRGLDKARKHAISIFQPEIKSKSIRVTEDERGLVITMASDVFFEPGSADLNMEEAREVLQKLAGVLSLAELEDSKFRIEGHTDTSPTDPDGPWLSNWELSAARSNNVLHYLADFGADEYQFQTMAKAHTSPIVFPENTEEDRAYNRRVDVVILSDGHL